MKVAPVPAAERERLKALYGYHILDTLPEAGYDLITSLAAKLCNAPISLLSFIDTNRQWYKSTHGLQITEASNGSPLCIEAITTPNNVLVIEDLSTNKALRDTPLLYDGKQVFFYAGAPVINPEGHVLGILSVYDYHPGTLTTELRQTLLSLAGQVVALLELRKTSRELERKQAELKMALSDIENIAYIASHDLKTPINNVISLVHLIEEQYSVVIGDEGTEYINFINEASYYLSNMVNGIHGYSKAARVPVDSHEKVNVTELVEEVIALVKVPANNTFQYNFEVMEIIAPRVPLKQILTLLLTNAIQYNDKEQGLITIGFAEDRNLYLLEITDTGEGIAEKDYERAFELFKRLRERDKNGENMGMGLAIVKCLVGRMHGTISVRSEIGKGTTFAFSIPKQAMI